MIVREFRQAWRRLVRRPGYAALMVMVLGVGLGVVVFLFGAINSFVLQPLPLPHADRLVAIGEPESHGIGGMDSDQYLQLQGKLGSLDMMGAYTDVDVSLDAGAGATYYRGAHMTASMMTLFGVKPILGRGLRASDDAPGAPRVVLLGETVWRHAFGADPHIVGRSIRVDAEFATVVGVLPASFGFPSATKVWLPLRLQVGQHRGLAVAGRLAPSVQLSQARAELDAWAARLQRTLPPGMQMKPLVVGPFALGFVPTDMIRWVWLMFGAGVLVLLLACINVANLQLVKTLQRRHELALRSALGSSRWRLLAGAFAESLLLSAGALAVALPFAQACSHWVRVVWFDTHPSQALFLRGIDGWVMAFGVGVALLSTFLTGGIPVWRASRANLQDALRDGSKGSSGSGFARVARVMVVAEVALTVVLLVGAGMFVRAIDQLLAQPDVGAAHASHVLTAQVLLPPTRYQDDAQRIRFFHDVVEQLRNDPRVVDATASDTIPSARLGSHEDVSLPGQGQPADGWPRAQMAIVDPHFLDTYGVRLLKGRFLDARDRADSAPVAVIDAKMAAAFWPHRDPLNRTLVLYPGQAYAQTLTVVGVVQSLQMDSALERHKPGLLIPLSQSAGARPLHDVGLAVRTRTPAAAFGPELANAVHAVDPQAAVYRVRVQARSMAQSRAGLTVLTDVFTALGLVALLLAAVGLYGVLAFSVEQRTRDIGIRRAIGAGSGAIVRSVGRQLFWQLGIGLVIGLALAVP
ncbi:MAG TPA: ABC transporter permease, partial [Rhodanobacteraceae bacterium]|nr:ABC transporter permease [Rhodanobacteraceae bacterium]